MVNITGKKILKNHKRLLNMTSAPEGQRFSFRWVSTRSISYFIRYLWTLLPFLTEQQYLLFVAEFAEGQGKVLDFCPLPIKIRKSLFIFCVLAQTHTTSASLSMNLRLASGYPLWASSGRESCYKQSLTRQEYHEWMLQCQWHWKRERKKSSAKRLLQPWMTAIVCQCLLEGLKVWPCFQLSLALSFHWPKARAVCLMLTWMSSEPGLVFNFPGPRLYSLGSNNVSTLILKAGICDLYYTTNQWIQSTRSAFLILNFYLAELIITDLLSYREKPARSSLYTLQRTSLLCNLWCEEFLKQSSPTIWTVWLFEQS